LIRISKLTFSFRGLGSIKYWELDRY